MRPHYIPTLTFPLAFIIARLIPTLRQLHLIQTPLPTSPIHHHLEARLTPRLLHPLLDYLIPVS